MNVDTGLQALAAARARRVDERMVNSAEIEDHQNRIEELKKSNDRLQNQITEIDTSVSFLKAYTVNSSESSQGEIPRSPGESWLTGKQPMT